MSTGLLNGILVFLTNVVCVHTSYVFIPIRSHPFSHSPTLIHSHSLSLSRSHTSSYSLITQYTSSTTSLVNFPVSLSHHTLEEIERHHHAATPPTTSPATFLFTIRATFPTSLLHYSSNKKKGL